MHTRLQAIVSGLGYNHVADKGTGAKCCRAAQATTWKGCPVVRAPHGVVERIVHDESAALRCLVAGVIPACRVVGRCLRVRRRLAGEQLGAAPCCSLRALL